MRDPIRPRRDAVFISSVLFTIALAALVPHSLRFASTWPERFVQQRERLWVQNFMMSVGFASLAFVLAGLIVVWMGYARKVRWTWFIMFVIVWIYAFPVYMLPFLLDVRAAQSVDWSGWLWDAIKGPGLARDWAKGPLDFLLMVVALFLPTRSFFGKPPPTREPPVPNRAGQKDCG
jgi:MFS family permease